jgi:glutamyl-tRNA reductase
MSPESVQSKATVPHAADSEAARVRRRLRQRAVGLSENELEEALSSLDADGSLTERQREVIETMCLAIAEGVLAPFEAPLQDDEEQAVRTVRALFDLEE